MSATDKGNVKILLFDVDGTLIHSGGAGRRAMDAALARLYRVREGSRGVPFAGRTDLLNFSECLQKVLRRRPRRAEVMRLARAYLRALPAEVRRSVRARRYKVVPGARRLLEALRRRRDVLVGLGTGNVERGARIKLGPSGLNYHFGFGGFGSDAHQRHRLLRRAVARARRKAPAAARRSIVPARDVFVIGDTALDVAAGKRAGFRTVAVATGWDSADDLRKARPDLLLKDFKTPKRFLKLLESDHDRSGGGPTRGNG